MEIYIGIDTSCYTTSLAVIDAAETLLADMRQSLAVPPGQRGLKQSKAVFQHVKTLPALVEKAMAELPPDARLAGVGASITPRDAAGSYMPVFKVGEGWGKSMAALARAPFIPVSHQAGHLMAGIWSAGGPATDRFLALHISGGTTELLLVEQMGRGFKIQLLEGSTDLNAGQFIDRVGVALGLPFPAGPHLEALARKGAPGRVRLPRAGQGKPLSFSGPESAAQRLIAQGGDPGDIALAVFECVAASITGLVGRWLENGSYRDILVVGGVAANTFVGDYLREHLPAVRWFYAGSRFAGDNAVGVAYLTRLACVTFA